MDMKNAVSQEHFLKAPHFIDLINIIYRFPEALRHYLIAIVEVHWRKFPA